MSKQHATLRGWRQPERAVRERESVVFTAWAEWASSGQRIRFTATGPEINRWMVEARRMGATRVGYAVA